MKGYGQYCPVARASEVFAERWTPIIVRNISLDCHSFNEILRGAGGLSKTLLADRLRTLGRAGIVRTVPNPRGRGSLYYLTPAGQELAEVCNVLGTWGARWMEMELEHMDPLAVLWAKSRLWDVDLLPRERIVIRFDITDYPKAIWILARRTGVELCVKHPGFPEDLVVTADRETLTLWHSGRLPYGHAIRSGRMTVEGPRDLVRTFPTWVPLSLFADVKPAASARPEAVERAL
ncbi:MAG: winged helix-turn-helix transcriptional regulator [Actinomycetota bacterium]